MNLISIIIPVYNAEAFVGRAIESCLRQSYADFELLCVNDGSMDGSLQVLKKFRQKDSRVKVMDIPNSGVVKAREFGVKASEGRYLLFMDADDELCEGALQAMATAMADDVDMVIGDIRQKEVDGSSATIAYGNRGMVTGKEHFDWIVSHRIGFLWGKLIRRELVEGIKVMPYGVKFCEDYLQMLQMSYAARKVVHIGQVTYNYIQQDESACNRRLSCAEYAQRFADLCRKITEIIATNGYDAESVLKLKVLFLYYCRLYLCANGRWKPNKGLKPVFHEYLNDAAVCQYFMATDPRRYKMTKLIAWAYPFVSLIHKRQLRKSGRIE